MAALAEEHRATMMPGRTHGQPAVPITFGGKLAVWLAELVRHLERVRTARERVAVVQLFGAAGTAAALGPASRELRHRVADRLSLGEADVPWHTARDSLAEVGFTLASVAATCGKLAREVIDLSRPEIGEVREASGDHRGASSTMPQKANPIESEVVVGLSVLAAQQVPALLAAMQGDTSARPASGRLSGTRSRSSPQRRPARWPRRHGSSRGCRSSPTGCARTSASRTG